MAETVALVQCRAYDREKTFAAVKRAVDLLGGIETFIKPGQRVLIKPNMLKASHPDSAVTTHPEMLRAVITLVRDAGARSIAGDSPGIGDLRRVAERSGILAVLDEEGVPLTDLSEAVTIKNSGRFQRFEIARVTQEADAIINLPKLKTHGMTVLTGAVKNLFGCVPGKRKVQWHFNTGVDHEAFVLMLVELAALLRPRLTIMDAIIGMEGNGPGSGDPRMVGVVLAGSDPVAVDVVAGAVVGVSPGALPVIAAAAKARIGTSSLDQVRIVGDALGEVVMRDFRLPPREHTEWTIPEWARKRLKEALTTRPVIDPESCVRCGICEGHCPQRAISSASPRLTIDYRRCIRCFCCQEFCPQGAISVGKGWALRILGR
jgi:uncharacterized protein (DUF362 family)/Pyruvate/2-oxoacid:ferredoxin oxidoreductase delta subunit